MATFTPRGEYGRVGLRLEGHDSHGKEEGTGTVSPLMYFKALREVSYGATLVALQYQGNERAVTTFAAILAVVRVGDGTVIWLNGGEELKWNAVGHWITGVGFFAWVLWRSRT